jgi:aminopeptidase N
MRRAVALIALIAAAPAPAAADPAPPSPTPPTFRLPAGVRPTRYTLDLRVVPAQPSYSGTVTVELALDAPTSVVWLSATDLTVDGAEFAAAGRAQPAQVLPAPPGFVGFAAPAPLSAGSAQLTVRWHGQLDSVRSRGLYRVAEGRGDDDWYAYTFFEPTDARRAFPCFDEPAFKVPWRLALHVPRAHVALANTPVTAEEPEPDGMKVVRFAETPPLPSYLVAFIVGPFDVLDGGHAGRAATPIRFAVPRGRAGETRYARTITPRIVEGLERFFDMPYPLAKLDVAVVPRFWGTMEHPGLVALGQPLTLIKPEDEGQEREERYANIAIHELAHYWFGDLVTCRWWDDTWLNESLAEWADGQVTDALEPSWRYLLNHRGGQSARAMSGDAEVTAQGMHLVVDSDEALGRAFDNEITYFKGASLLRMIQHWVGDAKLRGAIHAYLTAHAWGNAAEADFIAAMGAELGPGPAEVFRSFIDQPGLPLVSAEVRCEGAPRVVLRQRRFFSAGDQPSPALWRVPVCLKWDGGHTCALVGGREEEVALPSCPKWLYPNEDGAGYYRVGWDAATLATLAPALPALTIAERVQLAADVTAEARAGLLPLPAALGLAPALLAAEDPRLLLAGHALLNLIDARELDDGERAVYGRWVEKVLAGRARALGWAPTRDEDPGRAHARRELLWTVARWGHDPAILAQAQTLARRWLAQRTAVAPGMVPVVLRIAGLGDDARLFDALLAAATREPDRRERAQLYGALGNFHGPLLARALALVARTDLDLRDTIGVFGAIWERDSRDAVWAFLQEHWDGIVGRMRDDEVVRLFSEPVATYCDAQHRAAAEAFLAPRAAGHPGAARKLADALERAKTCAVVRERNRAAITAFLAHQ